MANNVTATWRFLRGKGLSPAQAAGVIGSMQGESGPDLNPAAENPGPDHALGIAQWLGGRKTAAVQTRQLGPQLSHLWHELNTTERGALAAIKGTHTPEEAAVAWQRVFERGAPYEQKYNLRASNARKVFNRLSGVPGSSGGGSMDALAGRVASSRGSTTTNLPGATFKTTVPTVDQSAFEGARRNAIIGQLIARRNPNSILLRSGLLSTVEPSLSEFMGQQTTTSRVPGKTVTTPGGMSTPSPSMGSSMPGRRGKVILAPNADRPGVKIKPKVTSFVAAVAGSAGHPITIGTGTNHNQFVLGTHNQSDHWTGDAADLPQPVDSHQGDMVAAHALQQAGVPWSQAVQMARKGGVFNVTPKSGPWKGHRVQVLWKTMVGGNHHNHVHVGIR